MLVDVSLKKGHLILFQATPIGFIRGFEWCCIKLSNRLAVYMPVSTEDQVERPCGTDISCSSKGTCIAGGQPYCSIKLSFSSRSARIAVINCSWESWESGMVRIWGFGEKTAHFQPRMTKTYIKDTAAEVEVLEGEGNGGNSNEEANKGRDDSDYFHPVGHNSVGWVMLFRNRREVEGIII